MAANYGYGYGGINNSGTATLTHSTVSGNGGGGVRNTGTLTLTHSTVSGNVSQGNAGITSGGHLTLINSTVSGNSLSTAATAEAQAASPTAVPVSTNSTVRATWAALLTSAACQATAP